MTDPLERSAGAQPKLPIVTYALDLRGQEHRSGEIAAVRAALTPATEAFAFPFTERHLVNVTGQARAAGRRIAGIITTARDTRHFTADPEHGPQRFPLGHSARALHQAAMGYAPGSEGKSNAISMQVDALPLMPMETAASTLAMLVARCGEHGIPVDFFDLGHTLTRWGNGISPESRAIRARVVEAFYTPSSAHNTAKSKD